MKHLRPLVFVCNNVTLLENTNAKSTENENLSHKHSCLNKIRFLFKPKRKKNEY